MYRQPNTNLGRNSIEESRSSDRLKNQEVGSGKSSRGYAERKTSHLRVQRIDAFREAKAFVALDFRSRARNSGESLEIKRAALAGTQRTGEPRRKTASSRCIF